MPGARILVVDLTRTTGRHFWPRPPRSTPPRSACSTSFSGAGEEGQTSSGRQAGREVNLSSSACLIGLLMAAMEVSVK
uniref:Uncharacterized protein n=1 Tax=Triticum urartu TaxID=4572 RepID=A0A8R7QTU3_TRIUA